MLINVEMLTIVSMINTTSGSLKKKLFLNILVLGVVEIFILSLA